MASAHGNQNQPADRRIVRNVVDASAVILIAIQSGIQPLVRQQVQRAGAKQVPVDFPPSPFRDQGHATHHRHQDGELDDKEREIIGVVNGLVGHNVFVGVYQKHVQIDPPQEQDQEV